MAGRATFRLVPMNILVPAFSFVEWNGGRDFLRLILRGLAGIGGQTKLSVANDPAKFGHREVAEWRLGLSDDVSIHVCESNPRALAELAETLGIDLVMPSLIPLGREFPLPWVGYVYDFQHRHLPHLFTESERNKRDIHFKTMLSQAKFVICNSQSVRTDARKFFPRSRTVVSLPWSPCPEPEWFDYDVAATREKYGVRGSYFIVCNQFWMHKDHLTAFDAMRSFLRTQPNPADWQLICTGVFSDYRSPQYPAEVDEFLRLLNLERNVALLGELPKPDQLALLRGARGLIQPTRFEGGPGGGAARDAASLGAPLLLSDIPVNREISLERGWVRFFPVGDSSSLANLMAELATNPPERPDEDYLLRSGRARMQALSNALATVAEQATGGRQRAQER
jgi:glycosyltransferase involved in cell wall biosynthesis